jgi:hypothetical protein
MLRTLRCSVGAATNWCAISTRVELPDCTQVRMVGHGLEGEVGGVHGTGVELLAPLGLTAAPQAPTPPHAPVCRVVCQSPSSLLASERANERSEQRRQQGRWEAFGGTGSASAGLVPLYRT